jgi:hypothetical protein
MAVEHRNHRKLDLAPQGTDDGELPAAFRLVVVTSAQSEDGRSTIWRDDAPATRTTLAENISRCELSVLIAEAADWLAWDGTDG